MYCYQKLDFLANLLLLVLVREVNMIDVLVCTVVFYFIISSIVIFLNKIQKKKVACEKL